MEYDKASVLNQTLAKLLGAPFSSRTRPWPTRTATFFLTLIDVGFRQLKTVPRMRTLAPQNAHLRKLRLPRIDHSFRPTLEDKPRAPSLSSYFRKFTIVSLSSVPLTRVSHNPGVSLSRTGRRFIWNVNIRRDRAPGPPVSVGGQKPDSHNCQLPDPAGLERAR